MKKTLLSLALVAASVGLAPATFAQDAQPASGNYQSSQPVGSGNWFIDGSVGRTDGYSKTSDFGSGFGSGSGNVFSNKNDRRTGYSVLGGYRWKAGSDLGLGLEAGYADLGNYKLSNIGSSGSVNQSSTQNALHGWMLGANGRINLLPQWYIGAHAGYFHANNNGGAYNDSLSQDLFHGGNRGGYYAGLGTGWDINQHFGLGVKYDYYHASAGNIHDVPTNTDFAVRRSTGIVSLDAEYRF
ncbi:MAG TPA: porin family protein [Rhodanobacter sp.]|nr:porin family protein [Rhodanobacter sp.]